MSQYADAFRNSFEPDLVCPACGQMNSPKEPRPIHIHDIHGHTSCDSCGCAGRLDKFLRKDKR